MLMDAIFIVMGLVCLFLGGEWLVKGSSRLALSMGVSPLIIGLTIVAFGTSTPELMVNINAALIDANDIAMGNIVGSNIANIGLILGVSGMLFSLVLHVSLIRREIPIMIGVSLLTYLLIRDGSLGTLDGLVFLGVFLAFNVLMFRVTQRDRREGRLSEEDLQEGAENGAPVRRIVEVVRILAGLALLIVGARLTVDGATGIARDLGISELIIGLTLVAVGTSLPELITSLVASWRGQNDIAVGNVVGSNIFNLALILGLTAFIRPVPVSQQIMNFDVFVMIGFAILMLPFAFDGRIQRWQGGIFLVLYVIFVGYSFLVNNTPL